MKMFSDNLDNSEIHQSALKSHPLSPVCTMALTFATLTSRSSRENLASLVEAYHKTDTVECKLLPFTLVPAALSISCW